MAAALTTPAEAYLGYAIKQGLSQGSLLLKGRKVETVIADPMTSERVKNALRLSQEILSYAEKTLGMEVGASYKKYVDLERDWVTQVVVAAHRNRLELNKFKFLVVGEVPYKGYFDEDDAIAEEKRLGKDYDVFRRKVPAFSSLGWFADPLTSILIQGEYFLSETLFHELVHLNFYFPNESDFNEAFATWFAYKAVEEFASKSKRIENKELFAKELRENLEQDIEINLFINEITERGNAFYAQADAMTKRPKYFAWIKECQKKYPSLAKWKVEWNNAVVLSFSTYYRLIAAIEAYATEHKLNYLALYKLVMDREEAIVPEFNKYLPKQYPKRCAPEIL